MSQIAETDLRHLSRHSDRIRTCIQVRGESWLMCGAISLDAVRDGVRQVSSYLLNATDFEHDSCHLFDISVVGVEILYLRYGFTDLRCWVHPDPDRFRFPADG